MAIFENYKPVLAFAAIVVGGVAIFGSSLSTHTKGPVKDVDGVEASANAPTSPARRAASAPVQNDQPAIGDFASDAELIDDTNGFDPTPERPLQTGDTNEHTQANRSNSSVSDGRGGQIPVKEVQEIQEIR